MSEVTGTELRSTPIRKSLARHELKFDGEPELVKLGIIFGGGTGALYWLISSNSLAFFWGVGIAVIISTIAIKFAQKMAKKDPQAFELLRRYVSKQKDYIRGGVSLDAHSLSSMAPKNREDIS